MARTSTDSVRPTDVPTIGMSPRAPSSSIFANAGARRPCRDSTYSRSRRVNPDIELRIGGLQAERRAEYGRLEHRIQRTAPRILPPQPLGSASLRCRVGRQDRPHRDPALSDQERARTLEYLAVPPSARAGAFARDVELADELVLREREIVRVHLSLDDLAQLLERDAHRALDVDGIHAHADGPRRLATRATDRAEHVVGEAELVADDVPRAARE